MSRFVPSIALIGAFAALSTAAHAQAADGKAIFLKQCRTCHGATGEPSALNKEKYPKIRTLADPKFFAKVSDDSLLVVLKKGAGKDMKSFDGKLSAEEMVAVVRYIRTLSADK